MQSGSNNKRKSPHHRADKPFHDNFLQRNKKEKNSIVTLAASNATDMKPCRFLTCAVKMANKNALVVLVSDKEDAHGLPPPLPPQDSDERGSEFCGNNKKKKGKKKKKKKASDTKSFTTCHLPKVDASTGSDWFIVSPKDAIARTGGDNVYKQIEIHVKPLLVLDINGILCHRVRDSKPPAPLVLLTSLHQGRDIDFQSLYRERIGRIAQTDIIPRTDLEEFLDYLVEHYNLALWSSAKKKTVKRLMHLMFPERIQKRLIFVWGQEKCECLTSSQEKDTSVQKSSGVRDDVGGERSEVIFMKHLSKVWNEFPLWNRSNTLLVDDSPEKCVKYKENAIHPPPIMGLNVDALARYMESLQVTDDMNRNKVDLDVTCYSDEDNQKKQHQFFQDLTAAWRSPKEEGDEVLMKFLNNNGRCHMNWNA